jgi:hypothetical protein
MLREQLKHPICPLNDADAIALQILLQPQLYNLTVMF